MGIEREIDALAADAIASSEKELFADTMDRGEVEADESGDRSLETMGQGLEGEHEADEGENETGDGDHPEEQPPEVKAEAEEHGRERGEDGRFKPRGENQNQPSRNETPAERGLRNELVSEREKRKATEAEATELKQRLAAIEARLAQPAPAPQPQAKPEDKREEVPDRWLDPEGYDRWRETQILSTFEQREQQREQQRIRWSFEDAKTKHGDAFDEAYKLVNSLDKRDPVQARTLESILQSRDPGERLVTYLRQHQASKEIGNDPAAFRERIAAETRDSLMKDPEFRKQVLAGLQQDARSGADGGPRTTTNLPPSLNSARGGSLNRAGAVGGSDADIFSDVMRA